MLSQIIGELDAMLDANIRLFSKLRDESQAEANSHKGAMESRHDTFKEEAQYAVDNYNGKISSAGKEKTLLAAAAAAGHDNNMFSLIVVSIGGTPRAMFMSPVLGGEKITIDGATVDIVTMSSPIGRELANASPGDEFVLNGKKFIVEKITKMI
ncbi:MAG: hypothetical protein FWC51_02840 [Proteobacteria bacterium]|nr:hypothetical protein [Pseudomonadota bacterium]